MKAAILLIAALLAPFTGCDNSPQPGGCVVNVNTRQRAVFVRTSPDGIVVRLESGEERVWRPLDVNVNVNQ